MPFLFSYSTSDLHIVFTKLVETYDEHDHRPAGKVLTDGLRALWTRSTAIVSTSGWTQSHCPEVTAAIELCFDILPNTLTQDKAINTCQSLANRLPAEFVRAMSTHTTVQTDNFAIAVACVLTFSEKLKTLKESTYKGNSAKIRLVEYLQEALHAIRPHYLPSWTEVRDELYVKLTEVSSKLPSDQYQVCIALKNLAKTFQEIDDDADKSDTAKAQDVTQHIIELEPPSHSSTATFYAIPAFGHGTFMQLKADLTQIIAQRCPEIIIERTDLAKEFNNAASRFADKEEKAVHSPARDWSTLLETLKPPSSSSGTDEASPTTHPSSPPSTTLSTSLIASPGLRKGYGTL